MDRQQPVNERKDDRARDAERAERGHGRLEQGEAPRNRGGQPATGDDWDWCPVCGWHPKGSHSPH